MTSMTQGRPPSTSSVSIRPMAADDVDRADAICRLAFGTFVGAPQPETFFGTADYVHTRWAADPESAFVAVLDGQPVGSNFAANWGSVGFFGPLTVRPDLWDRRIGQLLVEPVMNCFQSRGHHLQGLYTFADSPKHLELYRRFGFWPRFLTAIMKKPVTGPPKTTGRMGYGSISNAERPDYLSACRDVTDAVYEGLDLQREILAVDAQGIGDTVLLPGDTGLDGLAVCHCGPGSEAGADVCLIKFGAVRPGRGADRRFERLLDACESLAAERNLGQLDAGVSLGRCGAYDRLINRGFRTFMQGVAMHRPNEAGYSHEDAYVIDDWR